MYPILPLGRTSDGFLPWQRLVRAGQGRECPRARCVSVRVTCPMWPMRRCIRELLRRNGRLALCGAIQSDRMSGNGSGPFGRMTGREIDPHVAGHGHGARRLWGFVPTPVFVCVTSDRALLAGAFRMSIQGEARHSCRNRVRHACHHIKTVTGSPLGGAWSFHSARNGRQQRQGAMRLWQENQRGRAECPVFRFRS